MLFVSAYTHTGALPSPLKSKTHCFTYCIEGVCWVVQDHRTMGDLVRALVSDRETSGLHLPTID